MTSLALSLNCPQLQSGNECVLGWPSMAEGELEARCWTGGEGLEGKSRVF